jgi:eukaryotic-like serine/threonine-protein kinase
MRDFKILFLAFYSMAIYSSCKKHDAGSNSNPNPGPIQLTDTTSNKTVFIAGGNAKLYALDAKTGAIKWTFALANSSPGYGQVSSPVLVDSTIYIGSMDKNIYAINANTGIEKWRYATNSQNGFFYASPLVANGKVYVGGNENVFNAIDAQTGQLVWSKNFSREFEASAVYYNGGVIVGCKNGLLYSLDGNSGNIRWSLGFTYFLFGVSCPKVKSGSLYVLADGISSPATGNTPSGLFVLNPSNGSVLPGRAGYTFPYWFTNYSSPSLEDSIVYAAGGDSCIYAINTFFTTGDNKKWKYKTGGEIQSSPIWDDSTVYVGSEDAYLYAINRFTGTLKWKFDSRPYGSFAIRNSPVVANSMIFVSTSRGIFAINAKTGAEIWHNLLNVFFEANPCVLTKQGQAFHSNITGMNN